MLSNILSDINEVGIPAHVTGDFNIDVLKFKSNDYVNEYVNGVFLNGFLQIITGPTRCTSNTATLLDHVLTNDMRSTYESCIIINKISDHFPIVAFCENVKIHADQYIETRFITENNVLNFKLNLSNLNWNDILECDDTQVSYDLFLDTFF
jgi:hypothetical protein